MLLPYDPSLRKHILDHYFRRRLAPPRLVQKAYGIQQQIVRETQPQFYPVQQIEHRLSEFGDVPPIENLPHHACPAASAFHPSALEEVALERR